LWFWLTVADFDVCGKFDGGSSVSKIYGRFLGGYLILLWKVDALD
jgi:hypothetical protein